MYRTMYAYMSPDSNLAEMKEFDLKKYCIVFGIKGTGKEEKKEPGRVLRSSPTEKETDTLQGDVSYVAASIL